MVLEILYMTISKWVPIYGGFHDTKLICGIEMGNFTFSHFHMSDTNINYRNKTILVHPSKTKRQ